MGVRFAPYTAAKCPICRDWFENVEADLEEHHAAEHPGLPGSFWFENEFEVSDANPSGMTPCCGATLKGVENGVVCRACHKDYTDHNGWIA